MMLNVGTIMPRWPRAANGLKDGAGRWVGMSMRLPKGLSVVR